MRCRVFLLSRHKNKKKNFFYGFNFQVFPISSIVCLFAVWAFSGSYFNKHQVPPTTFLSILLTFFAFSFCLFFLFFLFCSFFPVLSHYFLSDGHLAVADHACLPLAPFVCPHFFFQLTEFALSYWLVSFSSIGKSVSFATQIICSVGPFTNACPSARLFICQYIRSLFG